MNAVSEVTKIEGEETTLPADPMVSMIERLVLNPDADLDKLERMLAMKERMDAKNARVSFSRALAAARAEIPPIIKDATVDFKTDKGRTYYRHETLAGIAKVIDPILSQHGISYRFRTDQGQGGVKVTCIVQHSDGHAEETTLTGAPDHTGNKNGFQAVGSAVTYLQRYTLKAALGLSAELDDDGNAAVASREIRPREKSWAQTIIDELPPDATEHDKARAVADALIAQFGRKKTEGELSNEWDRRRALIDNIRDRFSDMHGEIVDAYENRMMTVTGQDTA